MIEYDGLRKIEEKPEVAAETVEAAETIKEVGGTKKSAWDKYLVPVSILVAGVLIAGTSLYNTRVIVQTSGGGVFNQAGVIQAVPTKGGQPAAPAQISPDGGQPVKVADRSDQPFIGNKNAKISVVEFSDFQCPYCVKFFKETFSQLKTKYINTGKIRLVFRHIPLPFHQNAQKAAEASECANRQGKFSQYHDLLFQNSQSDGTGLNIADLKKYADQLGLNKGTLGFAKNKFNDCLDKGEAAQAVSKDLADAASAGVTGTPSFLINGKKIVGALPFSVFEAAIEEALKQ